MATTPGHLNDAWLAGKRVLVMGLGRFGGGLGVTRFLASRGCSILVTDRAEPNTLADSIASLDDLIQSGQVRLRLGEHRVADFIDTDLIIANPAVPKPWGNEYLNAARALAIPITTEIRLLVDRLPDRTRVLGITGTAGKSTTSAMAALILRHALGEQRVHLGGNIGGSLLSDIDSIGPDHFIVLELSSAQLHWLDADAGHAGRPGWSPGVATLTNLAPNHLDWHASMDHYAASKRVLFAHQQPGDHALLPTPDDFPRWIEHSHATPHAISDWLAREADRLNLLIPGTHNRANACAALAAAELLADIDPRTARQALSHFPGLPHRLQAVPTPSDSFRAFNDSKCTTPEGTALAVAAFEEPGACGAAKVVLIAGGADKGIDLSPMVEAAARCHAVFTIGTTGQALADLINHASGNAECVHALETAVERAIRVVPDAGVLLLSPGCASWDQFPNYEVRGDTFARILARWRCD